VHTTRTDDRSETRLTAHLLPRRGAATRPQALAARLSLEPGRDQQEAGRTELADLAVTQFIGSSSLTSAYSAGRMEHFTGA
jgi:hypothetical protein